MERVKLEPLEGVTPSYWALGEMGENTGFLGIFWCSLLSESRWDEPDNTYARQTDKMSRLAIDRLLFYGRFTGRFLVVKQNAEQTAQLFCLRNTRHWEDNSNTPETPCTLSAPICSDDASEFFYLNLTEVTRIRLLLEYYWFSGNEIVYISANCQLKTTVSTQNRTPNSGARHSESQVSSGSQIQPIDVMGWKRGSSQGLILSHHYPMYSPLIHPPPRESRPKVQTSDAVWSPYRNFQRAVFVCHNTAESPIVKRRLEAE